MKKVLVATVSLFVSSQVIAADTAATRAKVEQALGGSIRDAAEVARDSNRKPAEVLEFFGLEDDMKVLKFHLPPATGQSLLDQHYVVMVENSYSQLALARAFKVM